MRKSLGLASATLALAALASVVTVSAAEAHTGVSGTSGLAMGMVHPLTGIDHILAMVGVGLWAALIGGRARIAVPATFVVTMVFGAALGVLGVALPGVEIGIAVSVLALGALVALNVRATTAVGMAVVAAFAVFHGHAHGTEMPMTVGGFEYGAGFVMATAALHATGIALGMYMPRFLGNKALRIGGIGISMAGLALLAAA